MFSFVYIQLLYFSIISLAEKNKKILISQRNLRAKNNLSAFTVLRHFRL